MWLRRRVGPRARGRRGRRDGGEAEEGFDRDGQDDQPRACSSSSRNAASRRLVAPVNSAASPSCRAAASTGTDRRVGAGVGARVRCALRRRRPLRSARKGAHVERDREAVDVARRPQQRGRPSTRSRSSRTSAITASVEAAAASAHVSPRRFAQCERLVGERCARSIRPGPRGGARLENLQRTAGPPESPPSAAASAMIAGCSPLASERQQGPGLAAERPDASLGVLVPGAQRRVSLIQLTSLRVAIAHHPVLGQRRGTTRGQAGRRRARAPTRTRRGGCRRSASSRARCSLPSDPSDRLSVPWRWATREVQAIVALANRFGVGAGGEALAGVRADRFQHRQPRRRVRLSARTSRLLATRRRAWRCRRR